MLGILLLIAGGLLALYGRNLLNSDWLYPDLASAVLNSGLIIMCVGVGLLLGKLLGVNTNNPSIATP